MIKTFKWIYRLGYDNGTNKVIKILEQAREFHNSQAQIKELQEKNDKLDIYKDRKVTPENHNERCRAIEDALNAIDPVKYPNLDNFMDMLK